MEFDTWKMELINEVETAAEARAEQALADPDDPRIEKSQKALFDLADGLRSLPSDHDPLRALFSEEAELSNLMRATVGEPESRYHDAKEELLGAYGFEHEPFATADQFLEVLRAKADETISEYRLRVRVE